jgi:hypothetical protein
MYIMSKHSTMSNRSKSDFRNDDRYNDILLSLNCSQALKAQSIRRRIFYPTSADRIPSAPEFLPFFFFCFFFSFITFKCSFILL